MGPRGPKTAPSGGQAKMSLVKCSKLQPYWMQLMPLCLPAKTKPMCIRQFKTPLSARGQHPPMSLDSLVLENCLKLGGVAELLYETESFKNGLTNPWMHGCTAGRMDT